MIVIGCALLGIVVGGYVNVLIDRIPGTAPIWPPRVACVVCGDEAGGATAVATLARVRGRRVCGRCGAPKAQRRRIGVEATTAALYALAAIRFGATWALVPFLVLFAALVAFSVIDIRHHRLPDRLMFPMYGISLVAITTVSLVDGAPRAIAYAVFGSVLYFCFLFVPHLIRPNGMAFGDVKLAGLLGLYLGWLACSAFAAVYAVLLTMVASAFLGTIVGLVLMRRDANRGAQTPFAFGPALAAGAILAVLLYEQLPLDPFC